MIDIISNMILGEIGEKNVEVQNSIKNYSYDLTTDMVSEIRFTVHDPGLKMHNNNYYMVGRTLQTNGMIFEIASVTVHHAEMDYCEVKARSQATEKMRRDRRSISVTTSPSNYAAMVADEYGLYIFAEDSPVNGTISKQASDNKDESTWDVLQRLASDLDFRCYEAMGILFFASEKFIVDNQPAFDVKIPSDESDAFFVTNMSIERNADMSKPASLSMTLLKNISSVSIYPGVGLNVSGVSFFTDKFMVDRVSMDGSPSSGVQISATCTVTPEDQSCTSQVFARGSSGECVKRIQKAVSTIVDGDFGPLTEAAVKRFQQNVGVPSTGIVDSSTWPFIEKSSGVAVKSAITSPSEKVNDSARNTASLNIPSSTNYQNLPGLFFNDSINNTSSGYTPVPTKPSTINGALFRQSSVPVPVVRKPNTPPAPIDWTND